MSNDVPLAGQIFRELATDISKKNLLPEERVRDRRPQGRPQEYHLPGAQCGGRPDDVVAPRSSLPFIDVIPSHDKANLVFPTGHVGAIVSSAAQKKLWPQVAAWLGDHDA